MITLTINQRLSKGMARAQRPCEFISTRKLSPKEIALLRLKKIDRFHLPRLDEKQQDVFLRVFDRFWNEVVAPFDQGHFFWRNVVSSKMQEWERSAAYLALMLFTLSQTGKTKDISLIFLCSSIQEERVIRNWAIKEGWAVEGGPSWGGFSWARGFIQECANLFLFAKKYGKFVLAKIISQNDSIPALNSFSQEQVLIASLFYPSSFEGGVYKDPFFGDIERRLANAGKKCVFLCGSLAPVDAGVLRAKKLCQNSCVVIALNLLGFLQLNKILFRLLLRRIKILPCNFNGCDFSELMMWNARRFCDSWTIEAEIFYEATRQMTKKSGFSQLLLIYEGNVFERACIQAFRLNSPNKIVGYCHGVLYDLNLKLRLTSKELLARPEPDCIICTGPYSRELFSKIGNRDLGKLQSGYALRHMPVVSVKTSAEKRHQNILVALDGVSNAASVLEWLFNQDTLNNFQVFIRAHPNVTAESSLGQCVQQMPKNFIISRDNLETDIQKSFCVLYRHSSVGLQALLNGIPAVHLAVDSPLSGDPIEGLKSAKWTAQTAKELKVAINEIQALTKDQLRDLLDVAKRFSVSYFSQPTEELAEEFSRT